MKTEKTFAEPLWVRGRHEVLQALKSGATLESLFILQGIRFPGLEEITQLARNRGVKMQVLPAQAFKTRIGNESQGVAGKMSSFTYAMEEDLLEKVRSKDQSIVVALNHLEDPRNLGAIVRSAECAGIDGIFIPKDRAAGMTEWAIRTSQGAAFEIPVARVTNLGTTLKRLKDEHFWVVGVSEKGTARYDQHKFSPRTVLVLGGEEKGLGTVIAQACDDIVTIPMFGKISSLNVSVCAGILFYEILRQRGFKP